MKAEWQELSRTNEGGVTLVLSTATIRGRSVYSVRVGREREDGSIAPFFPLEFLQDDGATRSGVRLSHLHSLFMKAADTAHTHASEADAERATRLAERDHGRAERANANRNAPRGLRTLVNEDVGYRRESKPNGGTNKEAKREKNRREREQMRGQKRG